MLPITALVAGDLKAAADHLAGRAAAARTGGLSMREKRAAGVLSSLGDAVRNDPVLAKALLGGGLGAAAGGGHALLTGEGDGRERRRAALSRALSGGLAGAALGGGLGLAQKFLPGGGGAPGRPPGEFSLGDQRYRVDPALLRRDPQLLSRVHELTSSGPLHESLPGHALRFLFNNPLAPSTTPYLPLVGAADYLGHSTALNLGQRNWLDPAARTVGGLGHAGRWLGNLLRPQGARHATSPLERAGQAVRRTGEHLRDQGWFPGMIDAGRTRNPEHWRLGLERALGKDAPAQFGGVRELLERLHRGGDVDVQGPGGATSVPGRQLLEELRTGRRGELRAQVPVTREVMQPFEDRETILEEHRPIRTRVRENQQRLVPETRPVEQHLTPHLRGELAAEGARAAAAGNAANPALKASNPSTTPHVMRGGPLGGDRVLAGGPWSGARGLRRLGAYVGIPAAEWAVRSYGRDVGRSRELADILAEARASGHIRPVGGGP